MKLLQISIKHTITAEQLAAMTSNMEQLARVIAAQPGLLWKIWTSDSERSEVGGIYLFESQEAAGDYVSGPVVAQIRAMPGVTQVEARLFDIDQNYSDITRAPLSAAALAHA